MVEEEEKVEEGGVMVVVVELGEVASSLLLDRIPRSRDSHRYRCCTTLGTCCRYLVAAVVVAAPLPRQ